MFHFHAVSLQQFATGLCKPVNIYHFFFLRGMHFSKHETDLKHETDNTLLRSSDIYFLKYFINFSFIHVMQNKSDCLLYKVILSCLSYHTSCKLTHAVQMNKKILFITNTTLK